MVYFINLVEGMFMKIIIPFKKEVVFKDNISEITSISLEHQLSFEESLIKGNFLITGEYRISSSTNTVLPFSLDLPIALSIDENYDTSKAECDIDDFYYEIINDQKLAISIDICVDKLKERELVDIKQEIDNLEVETLEDFRCVDSTPELDNIQYKADLENKTSKTAIIEDTVSNKQYLEDRLESVINTINVDETAISSDDIKENRNEVNKKINSLFTMNASEYISYDIYIIREGDTVDSIVTKYNVDIESLKEYNDISDLKIGDKIIIPNKCEN